MVSLGGFAMNKVSHGDLFASGREAGAPNVVRETCCWMAVARRAPEPGFTKIRFNGAPRSHGDPLSEAAPVRAQGIGGARTGTRTSERVVGIQLPRRAPDPTAAKIKSNGGVRNSPAKPGRHSRMRPNR
jgi:hypothetical protein